MRKRRQKGDVSIGVWKDFPKSWPRPHSLAERRNWRISEAKAHQPFPWTLSLILHLAVTDSDPQSQSCSITQFWMIAEKTRADLTVSCWHLKQQYQENKCSGKHQLHKFLLWARYKPGPLHLPPLMLWGRREEIAHIWVVPAPLFIPWSLK